MQTKILLAVGIGGGLGAVLRALAGQIFPTYAFTHFPLPILLVNIIGCFAMGFLTELMALYWSPSEITRAFITTGLLGGFTTFSAFSLEYALIFQKGLFGWAIFYAVATVFLTLTAFFLGMKIVRFAF